MTASPDRPRQQPTPLDRRREEDDEALQHAREPWRGATREVLYQSVISRGRRRSPMERSSAVILLVADIVGSTEAMERLGVRRF